MNRIHAFAALIGIAIGVGVPVPGEADDAGGVLIFRVIDDAGVSADVLTRARAHVERIYRAAGVPVRWDDDSATTDDGRRVLDLNAVHRDGLLLTIVLVPRRAAELLHPGEAVTGMALGHDGEGARVAYVVVDRVRAEAHAAERHVRMLNRPLAEALILGHVIAHEAGHLMLPHGSHADTGLMKGNLDVNGIEDAARGELLFSPEESALIRAALKRQSERQAATPLRP